jgi:fatty-acyl-CoA synthase
MFYLFLFEAAKNLTLWFFLHKRFSCLTKIVKAEVEAFYRNHSDILDCYCVGVPDERFDEEVCIWVKLKPDSAVTKEQLIEYSKGMIAYFKVPKHFKFVDGFPINANGKVQKFKMVEQMKKELNL